MSILVLWCWGLWSLFFFVFCISIQEGRPLVHILYNIHILIFLVSQGQKTDLSIKSFPFGQEILTCIKSSGFCPNFYHFFLCPLCARLLLKYLGSRFLLFSQVHFFLSVSLGWAVVCVPEIRTANNPRMPVESPMLAVRGQLPVMTLKSVIWVSCWFGFGIDIFHG